MTTNLNKLAVVGALVIFALLPALARAETAVQAWIQSYNGPWNGGDDYASAVAVDGNNNVIVTGGSAGSDGLSDYATIKYSSAGVPLWTNRYDGPGNYIDYPKGLAVDGSNNVIVTGTSYANDFDSDYATIKYSSAGVPLWTNRYSGPANDWDNACAVAVDASNNVIVTGSAVGSGVSYDYATVKYTSAGVPLWTNLYDGPGNGYDEPLAMAVDGSNNVIVTGVSYSADFVYATIKYSGAGVPLWTNLYHGPANDSSARAVAVDGRNDVIVTGYSYGSGSDYNEDYATIKYSSAGVPLWTNRYNGPGNGDDEPRAVAVDGSGNVIVSGGAYASGSGSDFATIKYLCIRSPLVTGLQPTNSAFQLQVDDVLQPGTLVIEASTDLAGWAPVFTNTTPTNVLFYTDPDAGNNPWRFYRAFQFP